MEKDKEKIILELKEEIKILEKKVEELKKDFKEHRHDGHGYAIY